MKTKIFLLTVLLFGLITQKSNGQATGGNTYFSGYYLGYNGTGDALIFTTATGASNQQMVLTTSGFLGICPSSYTPSYKLDIDQGDINLTNPAGGGGAYRISTNTVLTYGMNSANIFVGVGAGASITNGANNTALGNEALNSNTLLTGNIAIGDSALYRMNFVTPITTNNVAVGNSALFDDGSGPQFGINNTAIGQFAMKYNVGGINNTATGYGALYLNNSGVDNTADGYEALYGGTGIYNTAVGNMALYTNTNAICNTAIGNYAGAYNQANFNTFLGDSAGWACTGTNDTNDVFIGWQSGPGIGNVAQNYVYVGNDYTTHISSDMAIITTWSDRRLKDDIQTNVPGLAFITKLVPVTYHYDLNKANQLLGTKSNSNGKAEIEQITQSGFIAQQVDSAAQACGYDFSGVVKPTTPGGAYALGYSEFVVPLVKSVQELNTKNQTLNATNDSLRTTINNLHSTVDSLRSAFNNMQACLNQICAATGNTNVNSNTAGEQNVTLNSANSPILYQNSPNPFSAGGTKINYYLPEGTMGATIVFYDTYGNQIKTIQLNQTGNGTLNITPDNLTNGIYSYSLIVNNTVVDTKKMVLQK